MNYLFCVFLFMGASINMVAQGYNEMFLGKMYPEVEREIIRIEDSYKYAAEISEDSSLTIFYRLLNDTIILEYSYIKESVEFVCLFEEKVCTRTIFKSSSVEELNKDHKGVFFLGSWKQSPSGELYSHRKNIKATIRKIEEQEYQLMMEHELTSISKESCKDFKKVKKRLIGTGVYMLD